MLFSTLLQSLLLAVVTAQYSDDFARHAMWPLAAGAYNTNPQSCITSGTGDGKLKRKIEVPCDVLNETCSAYTASSDSKKAVILVWRGSIGDYEVPMEVIDILFGKQLIFPGGAKVADFFYNAFLKLWNSGIKDDLLTLRQQYPDYDVWVTGHSLGAAMAGLAAGYLVQMGYVPKEKIKLITYGEPRSGDAQYAALLDTIPYCYRVVHNHDWVPHLPFTVENYQHHSTEIWYQNNMTVGLPYKTCNGDEDKSCSAGIPIYEINTFAHTSYFDLDVGIFTRRDCHYWK